MAKKIIPIIIVLVIVGGGAFYAGMKYGQSNPSTGSGQGGFSQADFQNLRNLSPEERQQRLQELGANLDSAFRGMRGGDRMGINSIAGEIIAKDAESITVKLPDGGSKIVFYSDTAQVNKFVSGTPDDLEIGKSVTINGKANQDGSITAESIQLRPDINNP